MNVNTQQLIPVLVANQLTEKDAKTAATKIASVLPTYEKVKAAGADRLAKIAGISKAAAEGACAFAELELEMNQSDEPESKAKESEVANGSNQKKLKTIGHSAAGPVKHWVCGKCQYDLDEHAQEHGGNAASMKFCPNCGVEFEEKATARCVRCDNSIIPNGVCSNCGLNHAKTSEEDQRLILFARSQGKRTVVDIGAYVKVVKSDDDLKGTALKAEAKGEWLRASRKGEYPFQ